MSGVHRFLSRREKKHSHVPNKSKLDQPSPRPEHFSPTFVLDSDKKSDKEEDRRINGILERLRHHGVDTMDESNARYALRATSSQGDGEAAYRLLMLLQETYEGEVKLYSPATHLLGAVNREMVTCFLDSLLFSMFARLDSFEAILFDHFTDAPRKRLAGLLRLWVNLLRSGRLITTDLTQNIQEALASCGWDEAARIKQQDPSEAFTFITNVLQLPLLTLKMDLFHTGKEDQDDHKFVNERLLEVAILDAPLEGSDVITLEDCLEHYFNNRIEVKRFMESQRRHTLKSANLASLSSDSKSSYSKMDKESDIHIEVAELSSPADTPLMQTPIAETPTAPSLSRDPLERLRPNMSKLRADSIFSQRKIEIIGVEPEAGAKDDTFNADRPQQTERKMSSKTEVLMPAWQFFKLLPWYTDHMPESDAQVAAHFSTKRPVLGICLKRYSYTNTGEARRRDTFVDIPLEIAVPNFVSDEHMKEEGPLVSNFRLLLQSVVCHRGVSVHSGHYISLCRGQTANGSTRTRDREMRRGSSESGDVEDPWMRFDDLAKERISYVDIHEALKQETPYLLFYQVQPIGEDGQLVHELPSYAEATSRSMSDAAPAEKPYFNEPFGSEDAMSRVSSHQQGKEDHRTFEAIDFASPPGRTSLDAPSVLEGPRGRSSFQSEGRRRSIAVDSSSYGGSISGGSLRTDPASSFSTTPSEEKDKMTGNGLLTIAATKLGTRRSLSRRDKRRPPSTGPENGNSRFGIINMAKLTQKLSRPETSPNTTTHSAATTPATQTPLNLSTQSSMENPHVPAPAAGQHSPEKAPTVTAVAVNGGEEADFAKTRLPASAVQPPFNLLGKEKREKDKAGGRSRQHKHRGNGAAEDRDCVVM